MKTLIDLTGHTYCRLTVIGISKQTIPGKPRKWDCLCSCGNTAVVTTAQFRQGGTKSCGCYRHEIATTTGYGAVKRTHGMTKTPEHRSYGAMIQRCENVNHHAYPMYGGRGIKVCKAWRESFETFYKDMGPRPSMEYTLDRYPNKDGNYEPSNCRWATKDEQNFNRRDNTSLTIDGVTLTITEWARKHGLDYNVVSKRIKDGWDIQKALNEPKRVKKPNSNKVSKELAEHHGFTRSVVQKRIDAGWNLEDALSKPLRVTKPRTSTAQRPQR